MRKLTILFLCILVINNIGYTQINESMEKEDIRMPFDKVLYIDEHPHIFVKGEWAKLVSIADLPIDTFINSAKEYSPRNWKEEIHSYMYYLLDELEIKRGKTINVSYSINDKLFKNEFKLKVENGDLASKFHDSIVKANRVFRKHQLNTPNKYKYLNTRLHGYSPLSKNWIDPSQAIHDLEYLEWEIDNNYSYAELKGFNYRVALDAIRNDLREGIVRQDLALQLKMFMANFGDGHSRVSIKEVLKNATKTWLPFEIIKHNEYFYAIDSKTKDYYHPEYPQIEKINGISIDELYRVAEQMIPKTTPKFVERNTTEYLFYIDLLLKLKKIIHNGKLEITFSNTNNHLNQSIELGRYKIKKIHNDYLLKDSIISHKIGYIAMNNKMNKDDAFIDNLGKAMQKMRGTNGLIIDIRRNGGGRRDPLLTILPYLIKKTKIVNVARYRINVELDHTPNLGYLKRRFCFPAYISESKYKDMYHVEGYEGFKEAVDEFQKVFNPKHTVDNDKFSDFHYMAVHPNTDKKGYYYDKPVIVLIDEECFSATDIFAAGIKTGDNVRLLGNTTGGGSGYSTSKVLPHSNIRVKLSRMISYQPDGNLYDGHGVKPDLPVDYTLEDRIGKTDSMLDMAIELINNNDKEKK